MGVSGKWEEGFRAAVKTGRQGWTVGNNSGRVRLKIRAKELRTGSANLPFPWTAESVGDALLLINRIYPVWMKGEVSLKEAIAEVSGTSDKLARTVAKSWPAIVESFRESLQEGRNQILDTTYRDNYEPYLNEALRLLRSRTAPADGHALLQRTLQRWKGKPSSRAACCLALRNLMDHAVSRHKMPAGWQISQTSIQELRGRPAEKKTKATLTDQEALDLIEAVGTRNEGWGNVLRLMVLYGVRPIELQFLAPRLTDQGDLGLWCSYRKISGPNRCDPRWLQPLPLRDSLGETVKWNLCQTLNAGLLELPAGRDGDFRKLNGRYVLNHLNRQPEWEQLKDKYEASGMWLRPYSFRDGYSVRAHRHGIETAQICRAMGHGIAAHSRAYESATDATTREAFERFSQIKTL